MGAYHSSSPKFDFHSRQTLRKRGSIAHNLSLSTSHRPDMTEILLKRSFIYPSLRLTRVPPLAGMEVGTAGSADKRFTHCAMGLLSLQKSFAESPGNDHEDAGEVRVLNENMAQTTCIRAV